MFGQHDDNQKPVEDKLTSESGQYTDTAIVSPVFNSPITADDLVKDPIDPIDTPTPIANDLIDIKQKALRLLSPLINHLDQSPEEKFHTTMMMIQASDDQSLVNTAFQAAQQITDEKSRAQALLDIVNEINYFIQQQDK